MNRSVLVADDETISTEIIRDSLQAEGFSVMTAKNGQEAWELLEKHTFGIALLDIKMPFRGGMELIQKAKTSSRDCVVIIMTAFSSVETAVNAIKAGADDFLVKPFDLDVLISKLLQLSQEKTPPAPCLPDGGQEDPFDSVIIGDSPAIQAVRSKIDKIKDAPSTVLITGESGTGKSFIAREIHRLNERPQRPFVLVDCAALPPTLIESELFGHERGAFTGAVNRQSGKFEQAEDGTIFLDEISCLPMPLQSKLLTVLQERAYTRIGGNEKLPVRARVIAATNEDLESAVAQKTFRADLFYRLNVVNIEVPPLRFRRDDIPRLAQHFMLGILKRSGKRLRTIEESFWDALVAYDWPGNVRELENAMESAILLCDGETLSIDDLPLRLTNGVRNQSYAKAPAKDEALTEREAILAALKTCNGHREKTAQALGISRRTLQYKLKKLGIL